MYITVVTLIVHSLEVYYMTDVSFALKQKYVEHLKIKHYEVFLEFISF